METVGDKLPVLEWNDLGNFYLKNDNKEVYFSEVNKYFLLEEEFVDELLENNKFYENKGEAIKVLLN